MYLNFFLLTSHFYIRTLLENRLPGNTLVCITSANHNPTLNHKLDTTKYCPAASSLATSFTLLTIMPLHDRHNTDAAKIPRTVKTCPSLYVT